MPAVEAAAEQWGLRPITSAPNVVLLEPRSVADIACLNATESTHGTTLAATAQLAADLLNGPGRYGSIGTANGSADTPKTGNGH